MDLYFFVLQTKLKPGLLQVKQLMEGKCNFLQLSFMRSSPLCKLNAKKKNKKPSSNSSRALKM